MLGRGTLHGTQDNIVLFINIIFVSNLRIGLLAWMWKKNPRPVQNIIQQMLQAEIQRPHENAKIQKSDENFMTFSIQFPIDINMINFFPVTNCSTCSYH